MPVMNQPSHGTSLRAYSCLSPLLLVLAGALGACGDEPPEPGLLVFDRDAYDFGQLHVGETSAERVFTVRNAGSDAVDDLSVRLEPGDMFELLGTTCAGALEASETCTITVAFAPALAGAAQADLVVEADRAVADAALAGVGAVTVRVVNDFTGSVLVESEPAGIRCGSMCEATFTVPEIVLSVPDGGYATWAGPCEISIDGACTLRLQGDTSIALLDPGFGVQWIFNGSGQVRELSTDAENNVIATSDANPYLFKLSPMGEVLWQTDLFLPGIAVAIDAQGNIGLAGYASLRKLDGSGLPQWGSAPGYFVEAVAFDPAGNLYVTGTQISETDAVVHLEKYDGNGSSLWSLTHVPETYSHVADLVVDGDGNAIIAGDAHPSEGESVGFLRKYDGDGNVLWTDEQREIFNYELAVDTAGNIFMAGNAGGGPYTLQKYAPDGALLWETLADDAGGSVTGLAATPAGDVIAVGTRVELVGEEYVVVGAWAAKFDGEAGTRRRPVEIRGDQHYGRAVAVDGNGDVLVSSGEVGSWLRKYDGAAFDQPAE